MWKGMPSAQMHTYTSKHPSVRSTDSAETTNFLSDLAGKTEIIYPKRAETAKCSSTLPLKPWGERIMDRTISVGT